MSIETVCTEIGAVAAEQSLGWALVGGAAIAVRTDPRFDADADVALAVREDAQAERVVQSLVERGHELAPDAEHRDGSGQLASTRIRLRDGDVADLRFASSGIERDVVAAAEPIEVCPGTIAPVAQVGHLIVMQLLDRDGETRPDAARGEELSALADVADENDRAMAFRTAALVAVRGGAQARDLPAAVEQALAGSRPS